MKAIYPALFSVVAIALFGLIEILLIRTLNKAWWKYRPVKWGAILIPVFGMISIISWLIGFYNQISWLYGFGAVATAITLILLIGLMFTLPFSGILNIINRWIEKRRKGQPKTEIDHKRRILLKGAAAALPVISLATSASGISHAFGETNVEIKRMSFPDLPPQLDGLKILHLSDSHLGLYRKLPDLEEILVKAENLRPDLVLITGDVADDLDLLGETLRLISSLKTTYGAYACLGNHEYYRGINRVLSIYDKSEVPLLRGSGTAIDVNGTSLYIGGADDPVVMGRDVSQIIFKTVKNAIDNAPFNSFKILMTHRPEGFNAAVNQGIGLTLAGHTHGGQVGIGGRSFFEAFMPERYLWGKYKNGGSQMYLSSGVGHWFPFRLGCPPEAPVIKLIRQS